MASFGSPSAISGFADHGPPIRWPFAVSRIAQSRPPLTPLEERTDTKNSPRKANGPMRRRCGRLSFAVFLQMFKVKKKE